MDLVYVGDGVIVTVGVFVLTELRCKRPNCPSMIMAAIALLANIKYFQLPQTAEEWKQVAKGFESQWNASHVIGAIDDKHVEIK